ncbi:MAG TPA: HAD family phosphatase [Marmoricola sp.]
MGVVFDLGNVLIRWEPERAVAAGVGAEEARAFMAGFDFFAWNHPQDAGRPFAEAEAEAVDIHPQWREHLLAYRPNFAASLAGEIRGTVQILRELHSRGVPVFALTNWSAETFHHAEETYDWLGLFDAIVVSGREGIAKPDREIFELVVRRSGHRSQDLLFVDDSDANVAGARAAGLQAIAFTSPQALRADLVELGLL